MSQEKFWSKVDIGTPNECWLWTGCVAGGYGAVMMDYKTYRASRLAYILHHGIELDYAQCVCHSCDNPLCCNPSHLWIGTRGDNWRDAMAKGRIHQGFKHGHPDFRR